MLIMLTLVLSCSESVPTLDIERQTSETRLEAARDELIQVNQELLDNLLSSEDLLNETLKLQASMTFHRNQISRPDCTGGSVTQSVIPPNCGQYWASVRGVGHISLELKELEAQKEVLTSQRQSLKISQSELNAEIKSVRDNLTAK